LQVNYTRIAEAIVKIYAAELVLAIEYLHSLNIVYRDLKPDNVLFDHQGHVIISDFGSSKEGVKDGILTNSFCGSFAYMAPEMVTG